MKHFSWLKVHLLRMFSGAYFHDKTAFVECAWQITGIFFLLLKNWIVSLSPCAALQPFSYQTSTCSTVGTRSNWQHWLAPPPLWNTNFKPKSRMHRVYAKPGVIMKELVSLQPLCTPWYKRFWVCHFWFVSIPLLTALTSNCDLIISLILKVSFWLLARKLKIKHKEPSA